MSVKIRDGNLTENELPRKECTAGDVACAPESARCDCRATETTADSTSSSVSINELLVCPKERKRNALFDVLRIIAMLFIVLHHLTINNIGLSAIETHIDPSLISQYLGTSFLDCFFIIGVNVFFLLSGYFGIKLKLGKIFRLLFKLYVFWILSALIAQAAGVSDFESWTDCIIKCLISPSEYWFVLAYIALCLLSPVLNLLAEKLNSKGAFYFVFLSLLFCCVIGFIADYYYPIMGTNKGYSPLWAAIVYLYGRLMKIHRFGANRSSAFWFAAYVVLTLLNYTVVAPIIAFSDFGSWAWLMYSYNNPLVVASSVAFFCIFSSCKKQIVGNAGKIVSFFGEHSFAVYILHCNNPLLSRYRAFFINLFTQEQLYAKFLVLLPNAVLIFVIGVFIDALYDLTAGKLFGKLADVLDKFLVKIYTKVRNRLQKEQSQSNL